MVYVLLLRGINVGGKNKVVMSELKKKLLDEGFEKVDSYINSGNLFFSSALSPENCISKIARLLDLNYDFSIPFAVISREEYLEERAALPDWWQGDLARKDVLFVSNGMEKSAIVDFINESEFHNEIVHLGRNAIFWGKYDEATHETSFLQVHYDQKRKDLRKDRRHSGGKRVRLPTNRCKRP